MIRNRSLLGVSLVVLAGFMGLGMVIPVRVLYAEQQGASHGIISAMATGYLVSSFIFQYPVGWLADKWGRKRIMVFGLAVQATITALYLFIVDPTTFVVLRILEGVAGATLLAPARALIADMIPPEKQGEAYGIFGAFFNAGFTLGPGIGSLLASMSYNAAFIGAVIARLLAIVLVLLLVKDAFRSRDATREKPPRLALRDLFAFPLIGVYLLVLGDFLYVGFDQTIFPLWMHDHLGADVGMIGLVYVAFSVPPMLLSPFAGRLADRVRRSRLILVFGLAQVPIYVVYGFLNEAWPLLVLSVFHGTLFAFVQPAVDAHLAASSRADARARIQGVYSSMGLIGAFIGANALTPIYEANFRLPLFVLGIAFAVTILVGGTLVRISESRKLASAA